MKRFPKIKIKNYTVAYSEETQEYKAIATISLEGTLSQVIAFEDYAKDMMDDIMCDDSEVDLVKEYIEQNKNKTCENCAHYLENIGYCEILGKRGYMGNFTCIGWTERDGSNKTVHVDTDGIYKANDCRSCKGYDECKGDSNE